MGRLLQIVVKESQLVSMTETAKLEVTDGINSVRKVEIMEDVKEMKSCRHLD